MPYKGVDDIEKVSARAFLNSGNLRRDKRLAKALDNALQCEGKFFRQIYLVRLINIDSTSKC